MQKKFYSHCYVQIIFKSHEYLPDFPEDMATIILSKITDRLLQKSKHEVENLFVQDLPLSKELSEKETHGLCYISGYIMHKLYKKIKKFS